MIVTFERPFPNDRPEPRPRQLFRVRLNEVTFVRNASDSELRVYDDATALLVDFGRGEELLLASEATHEEMLEALVTVYTADHAADGEEPDHFANALHVNRRLMNYLSARRTYLEFCEKRLTRRYGDPSPERQAFKDAGGALYGKHFAYRFAEALRNHCQHYGFPIGHVRGVQRVDLETNKESRRVDVCFELRELVRVDPKYWKKIRLELEQMEPLLPVVTVVDEWPEHLRVLRDQLVDIERPTLAEATGAVADFLRDPNAHGRMLRVGRWRNNGGRLAFEYDEPPFWAIRQISIRAGGASS